MTTLPVAEAKGVAVVGTPVNFRIQILQKGEPLDLAGKEVQATIRLSSRPDRALHDDLEGHAVHVEGEVGEVTFQLSPEESLHLHAPLNPVETRSHYVQFVVDNQYVPFLLRFPVRRPAAELGGS